MTCWLIFVSLFILGIIGIVLNGFWDYLLFVISGVIQLSINVFMWFFEKEFVYHHKAHLNTIHTIGETLFIGEQHHWFTVFFV